MSALSVLSKIQGDIFRLGHAKVKLSMIPNYKHKTEKNQYSGQKYYPARFFLFLKDRCLKER